MPQQRLTIIGWADPETIVKAIKKTRKNAIICSHFEPTESSSQPAEPLSQPTEQAPEGNAPPAAPDATEQPAEALPAEAEPPKDQPPEQLPPEPIPPPNPTDNNSSQQAQNIPGAKDVGEVHVIHHLPPTYGTRYGFGHGYVENWDRGHNSPEFLQETRPPVYVTHSYNTYRPSPYVTEYEYVRSSSRHTHYSFMEHYYSGDYHSGNNGNITSMFSDENPNACTIS